MDFCRPEVMPVSPQPVRGRQLAPEQQRELPVQWAQAKRAAESRLAVALQVPLPAFYRRR